MSLFTITYTFESSTGERTVYPIVLEKQTVSYLPHGQKPPPEWTALENCQCTVCPLTKEEHPNCPIAVNVAELVENWKDIQSTEAMHITVTTEERTCVKDAPAQRGLASILGIIMATSNCPIMNFLKPMARYHLPFSTSEETIVRSTSLYLLSQYFIARKTGHPDLSMENLNRAYGDVQKVNECFCRRIGTAVKISRGDAANNAVVILDTLSQLLSMEIEDNLDSLAPLFEGL